MALAYRSSSITGQANNTSLPLTKPAGAANKDLLVLGASVFAPSATASLPAGWTIQYQGAVTTYRFIVATKTEDGSAIGTLSWDGTSVWATAVIGAYQPDAGSTAIFDKMGSVGAADSSQPMTAPSVTTANPNEVVVLVGGGASDLTGSTITGWNVRQAGDPCVLFDKAFASAGATGTVDWTAGFPNNDVSALVAVDQTVVVVNTPQNYSQFPKYLLRTAA